MMYRTQSQSGFTLVEVLVAITILLLVVVGPINIITQANNSSTFATEQTQAFFLAQEGVELVQKMRDELLLEYFADEFAGGSSTIEPFNEISNSYPACFDGSGCGVTINSGEDGGVAVIDCSSGACRLYTNFGSSARSKFIHNGTSGNETPYTRVINLNLISNGGNPEAIAVTSTVTWRTGSLIASQEVVLTSYLFDIYDTN